MKRQNYSLFALLILLPVAAYATNVIPVNANTPIPAGSVSGPVSEDYDTPPKLLKGDAPIYPVSQLLAHKTGYAIIEFTIGSDGKTSDFAVVESDFKYYANHAIIAVQKWQFEPAKKDGKPIATRVTQKFKFTL